MEEVTTVLEEVVATIGGGGVALGGGGIRGRVTSAIGGIYPTICLIRQISLILIMFFMILMIP